MSKKEKRPSILHPLARAKYDGAMMKYREVQARLLPADEAAKWDTELPPSWKEQPLSWLLTSLGVKSLPPGSGHGFVQSPYNNIFTKVYGVTPLSDLPKYRTMIRNSPTVQAAIELQVNMAVGKGFTIKHPDKEVQAYLERVIDDIDLLQTMIILAHDMLGYGNAYGEILWDDRVEKEEQVYEYNGAHLTEKEIKRFEITKDFKAASISTRPIVNEKNELQDVSVNNSGQPQNFIAQTVSKGSGAKGLLGIKPLDPIYMRVRRDSWNNIFGYIQWLSFPPALIDNDSMIHIRYRPKSTGYESAYGVSILMPLIKNNDLLNMLENDAAVWVHGRAVPPLIIKGGGDPQHPYSTTQMQDLMNKLKERVAASMLFVKSDVAIEELQGAARALNIDWWITYLMNRRYEALGVPPVLMGIPEGTNRATSEVVFQDFITRLQLIQEFIADPIETQVLYPLVLANFGETSKDDKGKEIPMPKPHIVWKPIVEEDRNMRSQRLIQMFQAGAISVNEIRSSTGFKELEDEKYNEVRGEPAMPFKEPLPGNEKPAGEKVPGFAKPSPEGVKKKEDKLTPEQSFRVKKLRLLVNQEQFKEELLSLVKRTKFEVKQGDRTVGVIKKEMIKEAEKIISKYVADTWLYGKMDASFAEAVKREEFTEDDLALKKEDLPKIAELKKKYLIDFKKILEDVVVSQTEGIAND